VLEALKHRDDLSTTRLRDLPSAVRRVSALIGDTPADILLDLPAIAAKLATISPGAAGMSPKRLSNVRSDFLAAVKESGAATVLPPSQEAPEHRMAEAHGRLTHQACALRAVTSGSLCQRSWDRAGGG